MPYYRSEKAGADLTNNIAFCRYPGADVRPKRKNVACESRPGQPDSTKIILESISDGVFTVDRDWRITSFNRAAREITGISREEAVGKRCSEVFRASMCEVDCALHQTMKTGKPVINRSAFIVDATGRRIPISVSTALLRDEHGTVVGGAETFRDLSEVEELRKELQARFQIGDLVSRHQDDQSGNCRRYS